MTDDRLVWVRAAAEEVKARYVAHVIPQLERALAETPTATWPPMPDSAHPFYARHADGIRVLMADGAHDIRVAVPPKLALTDPDAPFELPGDISLTVQRVGAPAPYVGDPYVYTWRAAVDGLRRHVSGAAERAVAEGAPDV